jgi:hypothetical protein
VNAIERTAEIMKLRQVLARSPFVPTVARAQPTIRPIGTVSRLLCVGALSLVLAGCDKCGDWFWIDGSSPHSCKDAASSQ